MKKVLVIILLISGLLVRAANTYVATVANGGSDVTGTGTIGSPWATPKYGIEHTASGDTCFIGAGTFVISLPIGPPPGVCIKGVDTTSTIFNVTYTASGAIAIYSAGIINGNHHISNIKFVGNGTAYNAIHITRRSKVIIEKCSFHNFKYGAVYAFDGYDDIANSPAIDSIDVINCQFVDCSRYLSAGSYGAIWHRGVSDFKILNTTAIANYIPGDSAGFLLKASRMRNVRVSGCTLMVHGHDDGAKWAFAVEYNHNLGGTQFDSCRVQGVMDFAGNVCYKGPYAYSLWIHHCHIGHDSYSTRYQDGIYLENYALDASMSMSDVILEDNQMTYLTRGVIFMKAALGIQSQFKRIRMQRNAITNIGMDVSGSYGWGVTWLGNGGAFEDVFLYNNTITAASIPTRSQLVGVNIPVSNSTVNNWRMANNIITGFDNAPVFTDGSFPTGTITNLYSQNNLMYQNGNSNEPKWWGVQPTGFTNTGVIKADPLFDVSGNYRLQELSPAVNAGLNVGLPYLGPAPDIGAYEYVSPAEIVKRLGKVNGFLGKYNNKIGRY